MYLRPTVVLWFSVKVSLENLETIAVFPTLESPTKTTFSLYMFFPLSVIVGRLANIFLTISACAYNLTYSSWIVLENMFELLYIYYYV